jgi:hypothetical protein
LARRLLGSTKVGRLKLRWILGALTVWAPVCAWGFQIESVVSKGCHERLTQGALSGAVWPNGEPRPAPTEADRALAASLEFTTPRDADGWTLSTLIGARDNDLHGAALLDLPDLVVVHNGQEYQDEHCLRGTSDDGPEGDRSALQACRAFILGEVALALGDEPQPDLLLTEGVKIAMRWETRAVGLQRYGFHLGRAMHALQDSFSHAFRGDDLRRVQSVFNWIDPVMSQDYSPARDGWPHQSSFDACDGDVEVARRVAAAQEASGALVAAMSTGTDRTSRLEATGALLDEWLAYEPGCTSDNAFCGKAELPPGCASTAGSPLLPLVVLGLFAARRRTRGPAGRWRPAPALLTLLLASPPAFAEEATARSEPAPERFSLHASAGASIDRGGGNLSLGGGLALGPRVRVLADVELNPWLDTLSGHLAPGALSGYGSFVWRWVDLGKVELSSSISLGASVLLFRTAGADAGSFGLFAGASMLRLGVRVTDGLVLELVPEAVVAVPSLKGVPLAYRQYRASLGLRWDLGR